MTCSLLCLAVKRLSIAGGRAAHYGYIVCSGIRGAQGDVVPVEGHARHALVHGMAYLQVLSQIHYRGDDVVELVHQHIRERVAGLDHRQLQPEQTDAGEIYIHRARACRRLFHAVYAYYRRAGGDGVRTIRGIVVHYHLAQLDVVFRPEVEQEHGSVFAQGTLHIHIHAQLQGEPYILLVVERPQQGYAVKRFYAHIRYHRAYVIGARAETHIHLCGYLGRVERVYQCGGDTGRVDTGVIGRIAEIYRIHIASQLRKRLIYQTVGILSARFVQLIRRLYAELRAQSENVRPVMLLVSEREVDSRSRVTVEDVHGSAQFDGIGIYAHGRSQRRQQVVYYPRRHFQPNDGVVQADGGENGGDSPVHLPAARGERFIIFGIGFHFYAVQAARPRRRAPIHFVIGIFSRCCIVDPDHGIAVNNIERLGDLSLFVHECYRTVTA